MILVSLQLAINLLFYTYLLHWTHCISAEVAADSATSAVNYNPFIYAITTFDVLSLTFGPVEPI